MAILTRRKENPEARMSLGEHFREFRNRTLIAALALTVGAIVGWIYYDPGWIFGHRFDGVWNHLIAPLKDFAEQRRQEDDSFVSPNFNQPTQAFTIRLKISLFVGVILSSPVWLWQIWAFLVPGLTPKEKKVARLFVCGAVPLFVGGCLLGAYAINNVLDVLYGFTPESATNIVDASNYVGFVTKFILVFGLAFLLPVLLLALNTIGILPGRMMLRGWRIAVLAIALFSAMMSPTPDVWSMFVLMFPMIGLYYLSCGIAILLDRRRAKKNRPEWMDTADDEASSI
ncbi:twin-arginine translocase subunit TatC [Dermacoccaceae bacterium W4C1]